MSFDGMQSLMISADQDNKRTNHCKRGPTLMSFRPNTNEIITRRSLVVFDVWLFRFRGRAFSRKLREREWVIGW
jgi:hypothetical protein